jgi:hypothetical protein
MQPAFEVAEVLERLGDGIEHLELNTWQLRTLGAVRRCRTAALGGHIDACDECGNISLSYNSCRNRHCPKCQGHKKEDWIRNRMGELLPVPYFHVVFTLPSELNPLAIHAPKAVYDALFTAAWKTLETFGRNKGLHMGMISVLHTWGQNLSLHPHLHCIVPGGGVDKEGHWKNIRTDGKFLFHVKALSKVFSAKYMDELSQKRELDKQLRNSLFSKDWVVYAKQPFGNAHSVVEYLGRYTHKIAISNHRIKAIDDKSVTFAYKDYKAKGDKKTMVLPHGEFVRRFALHVLPKRFVKMRHYGFLSSTWKRKKLKDLQQRMQTKIRPKEEKQKLSLRKCPCCKTGNLITLLTFDKRGPPAQYMGVGQNSVPCKN